MHHEPAPHAAHDGKHAHSQKAQHVSIDMGDAASEVFHDIVLGHNSFMNEVYGWMCTGLSITGVVAYNLAATSSAMAFLTEHPNVVGGMLIAEIALVHMISRSVSTMSGTTSAACFVFYCVMNGVTLSPIFLIYTAASVHSAFFTAAIVFCTMAVYGYATKRDLTTPGMLCVQALWGIIVALVLNGMLLRSAAVDMAVSVFTVLVFVGLVAYDTQRLKELSRLRLPVDQRLTVAINGALLLYLDFLNLMLYLLKLFGRKR